MRLWLGHWFMARARRKELRARRMMQRAERFKKKAEKLFRHVKGAR